MEGFDWSILAPWGREGGGEEISPQNRHGDWEEWFPRGNQAAHPLGEQRLGWCKHWVATAFAKCPSGQTLVCGGKSYSRSPGLLPSQSDGIVSPAGTAQKDTVCESTSPGASPACGAGQEDCRAPVR